ncbi:glycine--tRNA ligase [Borrelia miyamotoi]|uniref:Glycine--tRNA ligase n=1 Tax=Borrelia miyamotoi TaxID=47466 RepID=A0AAX3JLR5_9SPIR|nr:glycine--tRNA ligase [Borrelia miyamotoi]QFP41961.1 glycine--tRNA ligase [Borrelia miyamotoi]QFP48078.1 glycine--tRNA ligase [Borrelia miyamotoi]QGT55838.1 glycine--tRNA ligase [Borrelia miyamotoi]QGT56617.1 glycine--tRNA ligase [Borrelia miyamotoi]WAZ71876.1 glycine--tRNA ligase [Borrelia miyamotoi]
MTKIEDIISLAKRKGFVFQSSEVYGGLSGVWDYGPLGIELKKNIQKEWWKDMVYLHDNVVGLDSSILMRPEVWIASGHVESFSELLVDCKNCKNRFRTDSIDLSKNCPNCNTMGAFTSSRSFNLMFKTNIGAVENSSSEIYLRPETAQGIFVNFRNVLDSTRLKIPFGIAQVGKAFRNEIIAKNFIFRTCEFEQMEMQFFVHPNQMNDWYYYWKQKRMSFFIEALGIKPSKLRFKEHQENELAHYAKSAVDIEYEFPFGFQEIEGIHNRGDYDLSQHAKFCGKSNLFEYHELTSGEKYVPYVIETSIGLTRSILMILCDAYVYEDLDGGSKRIVLRLHPKLAPYKVAILPLVKKDGLPEIARKVFMQLSDDFYMFYDDSGTIGKRYRRQDEIGTPYCVTIDYDTIESRTVTLRERDSMAQIRISIDDLYSYIRTEILNYKGVANR